jgi:hypothetical protein
MDLDMIFAYVIAGLAGLACIGALAFIIVWEVCAIRRAFANHRNTPATDRPLTDEDFWRQQRALNEPR